MVKDQKKRRQSIWYNPSKILVIHAAILAFRRDGMSTVRIQKLFNMPPRTLMRYVNRSKNPTDPLYLEETKHEQYVREFDECSKIFANNIIAATTGVSENPDTHGESIEQIEFRDLIDTNSLDTKSLDPEFLLPI